MRRIAGNRTAWFYAALATFGVTATGFVHAAESGTLYGVKLMGQQLLVRSLELAVRCPCEIAASCRTTPKNGWTQCFKTKIAALGCFAHPPKQNLPAALLVSFAGIPELITDVSAWDVTGLDPSETISSLLVPRIGPPIALVAHYSDTAPFSLFVVNLQS